jgi:hypothetical protein
MANKVTIRGQAGEVRWGYYPAASLGPWTVEGDTLTAAIVSVDEFRASQRPLSFVVNRQTGPAWVWTVESLQISGSTLTASVRVE